MSVSTGYLGELPFAERECERKYVVSSLAAIRFLARIEGRTEPELEDPSRPIAYNRTTYLDTAALSYLRSSRSGLARKLRIREYAAAPAVGAPAVVTSAFLELKESGGGFRSKARVRLDRPLEELLATPDGSPVLRRFQELFRAQNPAPILTTRYRRVRRTCLDAPVRITVDSEVCFSRPVEPGSPLAAGNPVHFLASSILEVKFSAGEMPAWLLAELAPLAEDRAFSKFEHGMHVLGGGAR